MAVELFRSAASRLHQSSLPSSGSAFYGKAGECLIRRTAVVRTRMPGGVGGVAPRGAPLSRLTRVGPSETIIIGCRGHPTALLSPLTTGGDAPPPRRGTGPDGRHGPAHHPDRPQAG